MDLDNHQVLKLTQGNRVVVVKADLVDPEVMVDMDLTDLEDRMDLVDLADPMDPMDLTGPMVQAEYPANQADLVPREYQENQEVLVP